MVVTVIDFLELDLFSVFTFSFDIVTPFKEVEFFGKNLFSSVNIF